jgi:hypothetical protein
MTRRRLYDRMEGATACTWNKPGVTITNSTILTVKCVRLIFTDTGLTLEPRIKASYFQCEIRRSYPQDPKVLCIDPRTLSVRQINQYSMNLVGPPHYAQLRLLNGRSCQELELHSLTVKAEATGQLATVYGMSD